jgi:hypothetical protein
MDGPSFIEAGAVLNAARRGMPDGKKKRSRHRRRKANNSEPYALDYFARKHDISLEKAHDLMRKVGRNRDKLNEAAAKIFRKSESAAAICDWLRRILRRETVSFYVCGFN